MNYGNLNFSFEDRFVKQFFFDLEGDIISLFFYGYTDHIRKKSVEKDCALTISKWKRAESKIWNEEKWEEIEDYLGIIKMIMILEFDGVFLNMEVNTLENKYVKLRFTNPSIDFKEL